MKSKFSARARGIAWLCTLVYFASYLMRKNFSVMLLKITTELSETSGLPIETVDFSLSIVLSAMTVLYGLGQVINGVLGDRIPPSHMLTAGLSLAALCNIAITLCGDSFTLMAVVWAVNGFAHAMLWPPIVRLLSTYLNDEEYSYAAVRVSWGSSFATIFLYLLCPALLSFMSWRVIILSLAVIGIGVAVAWTLLFPRVFGKQAASETTGETAPEKASKEPKKRVPPPKSVWFPIVLIFVAIVLQGMLRDGLNDWMPKYLNQSFSLDVEESIFYTVLLAVFSILSFVAANFLHRRFFKNEVTCSGVIFAIAALCSAALFFLRNSMIAAILLMSVIVAAMHGINLMLITVVPKRFLKSGRVSTFSGIFNAGTYVGSAVAVPAFAVISNNLDFGNSSWAYTLILSSLVVSTLGAVMCFIAVPLWKRFRKNYADNPEV